MAARNESLLGSGLSTIQVEIVLPNVVRDKTAVLDSSTLVHQIYTHILRSVVVRGRKERHNQLIRVGHDDLFLFIIIITIIDHNFMLNVGLDRCSDRVA